MKKESKEVEEEEEEEEENEITSADHFRPIQL